MSGKIEISRETLENSLKDGSSDPAVYASYRKAVADIRAILAAPVVERQEPVACNHEWTDDGEFTLICTKCGKEENHEPYGWVQTRGDSINYFTQEWDVVQEWEESGYEYKAMFDHTSPPAPEAVALLQKARGSVSYLSLRGDDIGDENSTLLKEIDACLNKVKELNQ